MAEIKVEDVVEYFKPLLSTSTSCRKLSVHILGYKVGTVINRNIGNKKTTFYNQVITLKSPMSLGHSNCAV